MKLFINLFVITNSLLHFGYSYFMCNTLLTTYINSRSQTSDYTLLQKLIIYVQENLYTYRGYSILYDLFTAV